MCQKDDCRQLESRNANSVFQACFKGLVAATERYIVEKRKCRTVIFIFTEGELIFYYDRTNGQSPRHERTIRREDFHRVTSECNTQNANSIVKKSENRSSPHIEREAFLKKDTPSNNNSPQLHCASGHNLSGYFKSALSRSSSQQRQLAKSYFCSKQH